MMQESQKFAAWPSIQNEKQTEYIWPWNVVYFPLDSEVLYSKRFTNRQHKTCWGTILILLQQRNIKPFKQQWSIQLQTNNSYLLKTKWIRKQELRIWAWIKLFLLYREVITYRRWSRKLSLKLQFNNKRTSPRWHIIPPLFIPRLNT